MIIIAVIHFLLTENDCFCVISNDIAEDARIKPEFICKSAAHKKLKNQLPGLQIS